jgi:hypothetical protein
MDLFLNNDEYAASQNQFLLSWQLALHLLMILGYQLCHNYFIMPGTANNTRPSSVLGIIMAVSDKRNSLSKTR